jgi:hypothetical protein
MKKIFLFIIISVLLVSLMGFALAAENEDAGNAQAVATANPTLYGTGSQGSNGTGSENGSQGENSGQGDGSENATQAKDMIQERVKIRDGNYETSDGKQVQVQVRENNQMELSSGGMKAQTSMKLMNEGEESQLMVKATLSNGRNAEIKVMPDAAGETALTRLKLKTCAEENGCSIELKEVGKGDDIKPAYEVKTQRQSRVLGLFKANMDVQAQVDAETGELLKVKKPWWAFLASEPQEE